MCLHRPLDQFGNVQKPQPDILSEHFVGRLVRSVQHRRHRPPLPSGVVRELYARILFPIGRLERQFPDLGEIQRLVGHLEPVGPGDAVHDGQAHVGPSELRDAGRVLGFYHGVHDTLWMDDYVDVVVGCAEEVVGFDDLQPLVHHRGTIQRDLRPHIPIRMSRRLLLNGRRIMLAHIEQLVPRQIPKCPPRRREYDPPQSAGGHALKTLEYSAVFAIRG
mmetsp:Transcript_19078/g.45840  ORF Transcript_19078/g.45840 Transcript_19078/m.45840 type:complete len:219 (-) Transcript_19078:716-1372(-)